MSEPDRKFLNRYFRAIYNKLEADALLFNRKIPHQGLKGSENEKALADVIRQFLPSRYGIDTNALVIDRHGKASRQTDIVIYDDHIFPKYLRKVYPIETVYAVIEVKTELSKSQADLAMENENSFRSLDSFAELTPYWLNKSVAENLQQYQPIHCIFGYRSETQDFGTFIKWFERLPTASTTGHTSRTAYNNPFLICALDKGIIFCRGDGHVARWLTVADEIDSEKNFKARYNQEEIDVDPAKALFLFLQTLWTMLEQNPLHPGFDIRSYMDVQIGSYIPFDSDGNAEES